MKTTSSKKEELIPLSIKTSKALQNLVEEMFDIENEAGEYDDVFEFLSNTCNLNDSQDEYDYISLGDSCDLFNQSLSTGKPIYEIFSNNENETFYFIGDLETELLPKFKKERDKLKGKLRAKIEEKKYAKERELEANLKAAEEKTHLLRQQLNDIRRGK